MSLFGDCEFAVAESVPQLDGAVTRARDDLAVIGGKGNGENVVVVADKSLGSDTSRKLPQAEGFIPGSGEGVGTVG